MTESIVMTVCAVVLTILIECAAMFPRWKGDKVYLVAVIAVNAVTNLTLNLILSVVHADSVLFRILWLVLLEIAVIFAEFFVLKFFDDRKKLFWRVLFANALSLSIGSPILYAIGLLF